MKAKRLHETAGPRYALAFEKGDRVVSTLEAFVRDEEIRSAQFTAIGAFREATLAYFDWSTKEYQEIPVEEQAEVASLTGNVAMADGEPAIHIHCVLGRPDGSTVAGHLLEATVRPTLELFLSPGPSVLQKRPDRETGLDLLEPNQPESNDRESDEPEPDEPGSE